MLRVVAVFGFLVIASTGFAYSLHESELEANNSQTLVMRTPKSFVTLAADEIVLTTGDFPIEWFVVAKKTLDELIGYNKNDLDLVGYSRAAFFIHQPYSIYWAEPLVTYAKVFETEEIAHADYLRLTQNADRGYSVEQVH